MVPARKGQISSTSNSGVAPGLADVEQVVAGGDGEADDRRQGEDRAEDDGDRLDQHRETGPVDLDGDVEDLARRPAAAVRRGPYAGTGTGPRPGATGSAQRMVLAVTFTSAARGAPVALICTVAS